MQVNRPIQPHQLQPSLRINIIHTTPKTELEAQKK